VTSVRDWLSNNRIFIPLTFDIKENGLELKNYKKLWLLLSIIFIVVVQVLFFVKLNWVGIIVVTPLWLLISTLMIRFVILQERFYRGNYKRMVNEGFNISPMQSWGIVSISKNKPYICTLDNGFHSVYISLHHGSLVGKNTSFETEHREIIRDVIKELITKGISVSVLNLSADLKTDKRYNNFLSRDFKSDNEDLNLLLKGVNSYLGVVMEDTISQYDILTLTTSYGDTHLRKTVSEVLPMLTESNIVGYSFMNFQDLSVVLEELLGFEDFSLKNSLQGLEKSSVLKLLWTEVNGVKTELLKSSEEMDALKKVVDSERKAKKKWISKLKGNSDDEIDLF
jgi:hypothetical protein